MLIICLGTRNRTPPPPEIFMIKRILRNISRPHLIPKKIFNKLQGFYLRKNYSRKKYVNEQEKIFLKLGLDRKEGLIKLDNLKATYSFIENPMSSEHQVLFASMSIKEKIIDVLEIGTFDGINAFLLSKLFDNAKIETIDLDDRNLSFRESYGREGGDKFKIYCEKRDKILNLSKNISFKKTNSMRLIFSDKKYDLIWIDGTHGYPVVTIDITNSLRLLKPNGIIICDDVWINKPQTQDEIYNSIATFETLTTLKNANIIDFELIFKRLDEANNSNKRFRKFLAYAKSR